MPGDATCRETRAQIADAHRAYQAARYDKTITLLPDLLLNVEELPRRAGNGTRRESLLSYVSAYVVAAKLATKLGVVDLATLAADRAAGIAVESESETARYGVLSGARASAHRPHPAVAHGPASPNAAKLKTFR